jgi:hypothetical protein
MSSNIITATTTGVREIPDHLKHLFDRANTPPRTRLIFALDATASRQPTWDLASSLTHRMFTAVADSRLDIQLVYFRGQSDFTASRWILSAPALSKLMQSVTCAAGLTQIERVLEHVAKENERSKVAAAVFIGDSCEEISDHLHRAAKCLDRVPLFCFQEGSDEEVSRIFRCLANTTGGAYSKFDAGSAQRLVDLLRAVVAYAVGGRDALLAQNSEASRLLLGQVHK